MFSFNCDLRMCLYILESGFLYIFFCYENLDVDGCPNLEACNLILRIAVEIRFICC